MGSEITIQAADGGSFMAYLAEPEQLPAPTVVVIQEIFGVNQGLRDKCDWLAGQGFNAVCPDLFWRIEPGIQLTDKTEAEWARAFELFNSFDIDKGVTDIQSTIDAFRTRDKTTGKIGCIGYCLGGKLAYLTAARTDIDASVGYYGVALDQLLGEARDIGAPLMLHIAEEDEFVPKAAQETIKAGLADNRQVTIYSYPGQNHAFTRVGGKHYDGAAAKLADGRTLDFLGRTLGLALAA